MDFLEFDEGEVFAVLFVLAFVAGLLLGQPFLGAAVGVVVGFLAASRLFGRPTPG